MACRMFILWTQKQIKNVMGIFTIKEIEFSSELQQPLKTYTILDELFSQKKGIMPSTITMIPGKSGIGKTTVCIDILKSVRIKGPDKKVLFISVEMNRIHLYRYSRRLNFADMPIFTFDTEMSIIDQLKDVLNMGWHLILIDSFQQLVNLITVYDKITSKKAEVSIIKLMDHCRMENNEASLPTAFICTMHMTKSDNFAGSAYIKYMIDGMLEMKQDEDSEFLQYMEFSKNRDGKSKVRLYYSILENGVKYDLSRYRSDKENKTALDKDGEYKEVNNKQFDNIFNT